MDIVHRVGVTSSSPAAAFEALTTIEGLRGWWAADTNGDPAVGGVIEFRFDAGGIDMEVVELVTSERVVWRVVGGPDEWAGTTVTWQLSQEGDWTIILFSHDAWAERGEFMHHCSTKWALFLMSLKQLLETGAGAPEPRDVTIGNWG